MEQILTLTEREINLIRYALEKEHDRLAKELITETERSVAVGEEGFSEEASALISHRESLARRIHQISKLLKKI